jgi:hypothetical protein
VAGLMVSDYSDAGQERWLADNGIDLLRGGGRLAGVGVVDAARPSRSSSRRSRPLLLTEGELSAPCRHRWRAAPSDEEEAPGGARFEPVPLLNL